MQKERVRLDYLDFAKAIAIFLVIVGHAAGNNDEPYYRMVLYTFHMPLFFMVSGVVVRRHNTSGYGREHWLQFLRKNVLQLVVPFLVWGLIYSAFSYTNVLKILYGSQQMLSKAETLTSLWFLPALFIARILMELILMISAKFKRVERHLFAALAAIPVFVIAFLLPQISIGYPWGFNCAFGALGFMLLGYASKDLFTAWQKKDWGFHFAMLALCLGIFLFGILIQGDHVAYVKMFTGLYGNPVLFFLNAFSGCGIIITISTMLAKLFENRTESRIRKGFLWVGRNTFGIYMLHKPILQQIFMELFAKIGFTGPGLITALCGAVLTLPVCCLLIKVIDRYIPQLFGKFPAPKKLAVREKESIEAEELAAKEIQTENTPAEEPAEK